jgi:peptidyl-prolyl cis-trans isomerase A (cyclophilin A)
MQHLQDIAMLFPNTNTSSPMALKSLLAAGLLLLTSPAQAIPVACFTSNLGNFCLELLDQQAPLTVNNFLNYINTGAYTNSIFHRSVPGFVVQGGGVKLLASQSGSSLINISTFAPVKNEFGVSNTRGTVAMAKVAGDPDSATSQWFVNLTNNAINLDTQNGGFTVFARILYEGMSVFDNISALPIANFGGTLAETPTVNFNGQQLFVENLVQITGVTVTDSTAVYDNGLVNFSVDAGNNQYYAVSMNLIASAPAIVFQLDGASVKALANKPANSATFSSMTNTLHIPSVRVDASTVVNNVLMSLSNPAIFEFTLIGTD